MKRKGDRIYLRPLEAADAPVLLQAAQDAELRYMTGTQSTFTLNQIHQHICRIQKDPSRYDFAICLIQDHPMIGELSILEIEEKHKAGFRISLAAPKLAGKGFGAEAIRLVLRFVFEKLQLNRLELEVFSHNERAIKAYKKAGFQTVKIVKEALDYNGIISDELVMAITRKQYKSVTSTS